MNVISKFFDKLDSKPKKILIFVLIGIALMIVGSVFFDKGNQNVAVSNNNIINETHKLDEEEIQKKEKQMEDILSKIKGVGKVKVMITSKSSSYFVMAQDEKLDTNKVTDNGKTTESTTDEKTHLMVKEGSNAQVPLVIKEYEPEIEGILILCEGAENQEIQLQVYNAAKSLMNVSPSKIEIAVYDAK